MTLLTFLLLSSLSLFASPSKMISELEQVTTINSKSEPKVFGLVFKSSQELSQNWDQALAVEIARVYSIVLGHNQNSYVIELVSPATKKWSDRFEKVLFKKLNKVQRKLYQENIKKQQKEVKEGNG